MNTRARKSLLAHNHCGNLCKPCDNCLANFEARGAEIRSLVISNSASHYALNHAYDDHQRDVENIRQLQVENKQLVEHMVKESKEHGILKRELKELKDKHAKLEDKHAKLEVFSANQTEQLKPRLKRKIPIDEQETESEGEILRVPTDREMLEEGQVPETPHASPRKPARAWAPIPKTRRRIVPQPGSPTVNPRFRQPDFDAPAPFRMFRPIRPSDMVEHTGEDDCPICADNMSPLTI